MRSAQNILDNLKIKCDENSGGGASARRGEAFIDFGDITSWISTFPKQLCKYELNTNILNIYYVNARVSIDDT